MGTIGVAQQEHSYTPRELTTFVLPARKLCDHGFIVPSLIIGHCVPSNLLEANSRRAKSPLHPRAVRLHLKAHLAIDEPHTGYEMAWPLLDASSFNANGLTNLQFRNCDIDSIGMPG